MAKAYRAVPRDQPFLLPVDMREWLPPGHLVWFVLSVLDQVDSSAFHGRNANAGAGRAAFDPDMLLALLVYGYCRGVRSSRQIERLVAKLLRDRGRLVSRSNQSQYLDLPG